MTCPFCGNEETKIIETRRRDGNKKRRRSCQSCGHRFNTFEMYSDHYDTACENIKKEDAINGLMELVEKYEREGKQWVKLSVLQAIKHLLEQ